MYPPPFLSSSQAPVFFFLKKKQMYLVHTITRAIRDKYTYILIQVNYIYSWTMYFFNEMTSETRQLAENKMHQSTWLSGRISNQRHILVTCMYCTIL